MASGTTYQALERLTNMPERTGEQGDRIAGQYYYDVLFTGGNLQNVILTNATINGLLYAPSLRVVTATGTIIVSTSDNIVVVNKTIGAASPVTLPSSPATHQYVVVKDGKGDANTNNITISGNGKTIDGGSTLIIGSPYGSNTLIYNGTQWNIIA